VPTLAASQAGGHHEFAITETNVLSAAFVCLSAGTPRLPVVDFVVLATSGAGLRSVAEAEPTVRRPKSLWKMLLFFMAGVIRNRLHCTGLALMRGQQLWARRRCGAAPASKLPQLLQASLTQTGHSARGQVEYRPRQRPAFRDLGRRGSAVGPVGSPSTLSCFRSYSIRCDSSPTRALG
jgi:hypothetical protein